MRLPSFQFLEPANIEEALTLISAHKERLKVMAGGTDLLNRMRLRLIEPASVMSIGKLRDLEGIDIRENDTVIGANTKLKEIAHSPLIHQKFRAIAEAAFQVASPSILNMATLGGNLLQNTRCLYYNQSGMVLNGLERCHKRGGTLCLAVRGGKRCFSVYQGDMAPALIAFDARCVLEKKDSRRTVALTELFTGNGVNPFAIGADELLTKILIPQPKGRFSSAYRKLRLRGSVDYPLVSTAVLVSATQNGEMNGCRVVLGAVGASPRVMDGPSREADLESMVQRTYELSEAVDNLQMPGAYRRKMAGVLARRAIRVALDRMKEEG
jgi:4-hydroxybenzoyl-CoA reductase subunit beta